MKKPHIRDNIAHLSKKTRSLENFYDFSYPIRFLRDLFLCFRALPFSLFPDFSEKSLTFLQPVVF